MNFIRIKVFSTKNSISWIYSHDGSSACSEAKRDEIFGKRKKFIWGLFLHITLSES